MKIEILVILILIVLSGCKKESVSTVSLDYLPASSILDNALVWKYYKYITTEGDQEKVDIQYKRIIKTEDTLSITSYDAGFVAYSTTQYLIKDNKWIVVNSSFRNTNYVIKDSIYLDWNGQGAMSIFEIDNISLQHKLNSRKDTMIANERHVIFSGTKEFFLDNDTITEYWTKLYKEKLGLIKYTSSREGYTIKGELDEVMTFAEFENRSRNGLQRVGYIDTTQILDKERSFTTCRRFDQINDYYNGDIAQFVGGKGRLRAVLAKKLDHQLLSDQSGYLSFHFVINCEGEAGWFTTVECGLDYQSKTFSKALKDHLLDILLNEEKWKPLSINEEKRDSYTYITFKIKDGEIIELLP